MSNIHVIHGEVPELIDRETEQLTQKYLGNEPKDDFNYVKYNLYETTLNTIIEEAMTLPFFRIKRLLLYKIAIYLPVKNHLKRHRQTLTAY